MNGYWNHVLISLRLTFRNKQALVFSYVFPLVFLFMFGLFFSVAKTPLVLALGQLLTLTVLGASCFGLPITIVTERERGIWRRYRLTPMPTSGFVSSTLLSRFLILISSAILQIALAMAVFNMPLPLHPIELAVVFTFVSFAFMGIGLVIATVANNTASAQALAQTVFMPLMFLGGVGIPLRLLPPWLQDVAAFLPGRYAVEAFRQTITGAGGLLTKETLYDLMALTLIGVSACIVASKLFRWETQQRLGRNAKWWLLLALLSWAAAGLGAHWLDLVQTPRAP